MTFSRTLLAAAAAAVVALPIAAQNEGGPPPYPARPSFALVNGGRDLILDHGPAYGPWAITVGIDRIDGPLPVLERGELFAFEPLFVAAYGRLDANGFGWLPIDLQDAALAGQSLLLQAFVADPRITLVASSQPLRVEFDAPPIDEPVVPPGERVVFRGADPLPWQATAALWCACGEPMPAVGVDIEVVAPTGGHALRVGAVRWYENIAVVAVTIVRPEPGAIVTEALEVLDVSVPLGTRAEAVVIDLAVVQRMREAPLPVLRGSYVPAGVIGIGK